MEKVLNNSYFVGETNVLTSNGYCSIENVTTECEVLDGNNEFQYVKEVQKSTTNEILELTTIDGTIFRATKNQFFMVTQKKKGIFTVPQRKMLCKLKKDDFLVSHYEYDGSGHIYYQYEAIKSIKTIQETKEVFNIILENNHSFVVDGKIVYDNSMLVNA